MLFFLTLKVNLLWSYSIIHFSLDTTAIPSSSQLLSILGQIYSNLEYTIFHSYCNNNNVKDNNDNETLLESSPLLEEEDDGHNNIDNTSLTKNATTTNSNHNNQFQLSNINLFTLNKLLQASLFFMQTHSTKQSQPSSSSFQQQQQQQFLLENNDNIINDNYIKILLQLFINKIMEEQSSSSSVQMINHYEKVHDIIQLCQLLSTYLQHREKSNLSYTMKETVHNFVQSIYKYIDATLPKIKEMNSNNYVLLYTSLYQIQNHVEDISKNNNNKNNYNDKMTTSTTSITIALNLFKSIHMRNIKSLSSPLLLQFVSF